MPTVLILSTEIFEEIVNYLDEPAHLLSFALTTRVLKAIIIPRHIQFRRIRSYPRNARLWEYLIQHPLQASYIRNLEVVAEQKGALNEPLLVPQSVQGVVKFTPPGDSYSVMLGVHLLSLAIPLMTSLVRLSWTDSTLGSKAIDHILHGINQLPVCPEELYVKALPWKTKERNRNITSEQTLSPNHILGLKKCIIDTPRENETFRPKPLISSLITQPGTIMTHLRIVVPGYSLSRNLLLVADWPTLKSLSLICHIQTAEMHASKVERLHIVKGFISKHSQLESLLLDGNMFFGDVVKIQANTMINLRALSFPGLSFWDGSDWLPLDLQKTLWHIQLTFNKRTLNYLERLKSLRFCSIIIEDLDILKQFVLLVPSLERLSFISHIKTLLKPAPVSLAHEDVSNCLAKLTKLTHLAQYCKETPLSEDTLRSLCGIRSLQCIETGTGWIQLDRDDQGSYLSHHSINGSRCSPLTWGGFF